MHRLPNVAQFSTTFDLRAQNLDRDELADLFLAQNDFSVPGRYSRYDLGQGLLLRGDGTGNVTAVPASESNIMLHGKQCGVVAVDFNDDGQPDLAVSQQSVAPWLLSGVKQIELIGIVPQGTTQLVPSQRDERFQTGSVTQKPGLTQPEKLFIYLGFSACECCRPLVQPTPSSASLLDKIL